MGIEEVFIDPWPGCEDVVPGIVTPGGPPSPPIDPSVGGASKKKRLLTEKKYNRLVKYSLEFRFWSHFQLKPKCLLALCNSERLLQLVTFNYVQPS